MTKNDNQKYLFPHELLGDDIKKRSDVKLPEDVNERKKYGRALMGLELISKFDSWIDHGLEHLDSEVPKIPKRNIKMFNQEKKLRELLTSLNDDQKEAVQYLIKNLLHGMLFITLGYFDQPTLSDAVEITLKNKIGDDIVEIPINSDSCIDLHDELLNWIYSFSRYKDDFFVVSKENDSYCFSPKGFDYT